MKPNGLVAAARMTSHASMPRRRDIMRDLVDEADVHGAERVFEQLHHLGRVGARDRHQRVDDLRVERRGHLEAAPACCRR